MPPMSEPQPTTEVSEDARVTTSDRIARAVRALQPQSRRMPPKDLTEQVAYLERDLAEVRTRVNALFFAVLTAALGQVIAKVLG